MTREEAFQNLNLPLDADPEAIEKAYRRLVRRYPPEFHPDRFRTIDDSYRLLVSLPAMIEKILAPEVEEAKFNPDLLTFAPPPPPESCVDEALRVIRSIALTEAVWKRTPAGRTPRGKPKR